MAIETFSPQPDSDNDLEWKMITSDVISQADIENYADEIVRQINSIKDGNEKTSFVVDALQNQILLEKFKFWRNTGLENAALSKEDLDELGKSINKVRLALIEKLKGKVDDEVYFVIKDLVITKRGKEPNLISQVFSKTSGKDRVFKEQPALPGQEDEVEAGITNFIKITQVEGSHPNIVQIKEYDPVSQRIIYENLNLQPLEEYLELGIKNKTNFVTSLKVIEDCLVGAEYLAEKGLVLQDIKLSNLGLVTDEDKNKKGMLFDMEGLVGAGVELENRLRSKDYLPPEFFRGEAIMPSEMTYQFGICLKKIFEIFEKESIFKKMYKNKLEELQELYKKMITPEPEERITLTETKNRLGEILAELI